MKGKNIIKFSGTQVVGTAGFEVGDKNQGNDDQFLFGIDRSGLSRFGMETMDFTILQPMKTVMPSGSIS